MADFSLLAKFGMDATGVKTELKNVRKELNDTVSDVTKLGAAAAGTAFVALSKGAIDLAGNLADTANNIGINVESLQALEAQHKRNGVSNEQLVQGLQKVKSAVIDAADGNAKAAESLQKLGLSADKLVRLPLDQQYEAIAKAAAAAKDQNEAYSAVTTLLGEKVGPRLMGSLKELAEQGLPAVTEQARQAGQVMSAETIVQLDRAGDAIDDFKLKAEIALGNIIVNFRSEEGIKLLLYQFLDVVGKFGARLVDAVVEGGQMVWAVFKGAFTGVVNYLRDGMVDAMKVAAEAINKILPSKWEINIAGLDQLKSSGEGIGDSITRAIAQTTPSKFVDTVGSFWDEKISEQKKVVDALNAKDFGKDAQSLRDAGNAIGTSINVGASSVAKSGDSAGGSIKDGASALDAAGSSVGGKIKVSAEQLAAAVSKMAWTPLTISQSHGSLLPDPSATSDLSNISTTALQSAASEYSALIARLQASKSGSWVDPLTNTSPVGAEAVSGYFTTNMASAQVGQALDKIVQELSFRTGFSTAYDKGGAPAAMSYYQAQGGNALSFDSIVASMSSWGQGLDTLGQQGKETNDTLAKLQGTASTIQEQLATIIHG